ncbi:hypothetical protein FOZ62_004122, partial [Perkinsus olseni]
YCEKFCVFVVSMDRSFLPETPVPSSLSRRIGGGHWDKPYNRGSLMLRAEISTVGDSQEVSSIHSGQSRLTTVGDRLMDSKCKCGAKEQLILCKSRLEHLVGDDRKRRRCAVNRGKLAAAGQAALRILSDDLLAAVTEAEAEMKACAARIIQEELVAGQLRESEIGIVERGCALGALRDKVASLRAIEKASQEKLRRHVDRREAERGSVLEQLHSRLAVCNELRATLTAIKSRLSLMRHRVRSRQDSLEVARSDMEVYRKVLDEVPAIMVDLANGERETLQRREELERRAMALSEEMKEIDTQIASVTNSRAQEVGGRKRCLEREGKELDQLAQRLDAMQEYVGDCQQRRMSGSSRL